ncbi:Dps family protein [Streptococcus cuniculipharyngis]|uniref:DNA starvation/stationary phase protection protein n=1 Tax=Streptococcus cuniculipharyngis TaxID=1562651 RepID=A0A5C5S986_9STRE|nr:ferritin-like domain-containing protein [Streptococcus cuniculipharyngis]TWS96915.1 DNA starvation/stationary phase protection protein [Streptococcus cuniculipharyngis]
MTEHTYPQTKQVLNQAVADIYKAISIIRQAHWYMRGQGFLYLHKQMDKLIDGLDGHLDELSERLIMLGGAPYSTLKEYDQVSQLVEVEGSFEVPMAERLNRLVDLYEYLATLYRQGLAVTDEENEAVANGLFADALADAEKVSWMLKAELSR